MRAVAFEQFGGPEVLEVRDIEPPVPGPGQVLVRVLAAGVNAFDLQIRQGLAGFPIPLPFVGGMEAVGVIEALGDGVEGWTTGQRVLRDTNDSCNACRYCRSGQEWRCVSGNFTYDSISMGFAELLVCDARRLIALPDAIDDVTAAAVQMSYATAWHMLHARAGLLSGDRILISSVGSGLGLAAADIAREAGAFVIATSSSDEKLEKAKARGVDEVINYTTTNVPERVMEITGGAGVEISFEHVGGDAFADALASLAIDGRLVTCGWPAGREVGFDLMDLCRMRKQIIGAAGKSADDLHRCLELVERGRLSPEIAATFPLEQVREGVELLERRAAFGKVVITH